MKGLPKLNNQGSPSFFTFYSFIFCDYYRNRCHCACHLRMFASPLKTLVSSLENLKCSNVRHGFKPEIQLDKLQPEDVKHVITLNEQTSKNYENLQNHFNN